MSYKSINLPRELLECEVVPSLPEGFVLQESDGAHGPFRDVPEGSRITGRYRRLKRSNLEALGTSFKWR